MARTKIIVIGNEKGGSGKTTIAMHLIVSLLKLGFKIGALDTDLRQQSLGRYIENRINTKAKQEGLLVPSYKKVEAANVEKILSSQDLQEAMFKEALEQGNDFLVIDTPGSDTPLNRLMHRHADLIITPINDSFVDLDLIAKINSETFTPYEAGIYSQIIWDEKMQRATKGRDPLHWLVVRNRLSSLASINKRNVEEALRKAAAQYGFKVIPGFSERVIFRELFLKGLTLLDTLALKEEEIDTTLKLNASMLAARAELWNFIKSLPIKELQATLKQVV